MRPSAKRCESPESFHDWLRSPRGVRRSYSTNPSPSRSPHSSIHASARSAGLVQLAREAEVLRPADHLREQDEPERCRVDRAVVDGEPALRRLAVPHLVADLPRLCVDLRVVDLRLQARQRAQRPDRELGPEEQRLERGDERVAAEHGHEPRHPCGRELVEAALRADPQGGEVGDRPGERADERVPRPAQLRHLELPGRERVADVVELAAEVLLGVARVQRRPVRRDVDVEVEVPLLARLELDRPRDRRRRPPRRAARGSPASARATPRRGPPSRTARAPGPTRRAPGRGAAPHGAGRRARSRGPSR